MSAAAVKTQVLIVGAGPVGQGLAIELGLRGIACIVIDRNDRVGVAPRAKTTNVRSREHFRRWGMADKLRAASPLGIDYPSNIIFTTRLAGYQLARFDNALYCAPGRNPLYAEHAQWIPQYKVEQVMREHMQGLPSVQLRLQCQLHSLEQNADGVLANITCPDGLAPQRIEADYVVGCDGARSSVRAAIGATMEGQYGMSRNYNFVFRAPGLEQAHQHGKAIMYWQINGDLPSIIGPMDDGDRWFFMPTALPPGLEITRENAPDYIRKATGIDLPYEILSADEWVASELLATHYRDRRVFIAGDAAHLHPPFGGFGMNMGIGDAVDLGWKLAAVLQGWGGETLLASYEYERRRVHQHVIGQASANHALLGGSLLAPGLEDDTEQGEALRAATGLRIGGAKLAEFYTLGTILGDCHAGSPIIAGDPVEDSATPRDFLNYVQRADPGCRAPHAWLHDGSSLYDHFGQGFTLLVTDSAALADAQRASADAVRNKVPLTILSEQTGGVRQLYPRALTLIRPDQHIAWTGSAWPADSDLFAIVTGRHATTTTPLKETKMNQATTVAPVPAKLAHVVLRTSQFAAMQEWYLSVLAARTIYADAGLAFLTYDEEHHRVALLNAPDLAPQGAGMAGVHHVAFTYANLGDLVATFERLRDLAIMPVYCTNHGPTTSLYYQDPDGNQIELQVDNFDTIEEATAFFYSPEFGENPIGVDFDPAELARRFHAGEADADIKRRPSIGQRGLDSLPLR